MFTLKEVVLWLHVLLACVWVGGMLSLVFVYAPYLRRLPNKEQAFLYVGKRLSLLGTFISLPLLFVTGMANAYLLNGWDVWFQKDSPYTRTLQVKLIFFGGIVAVSLLHDLYFGRRAFEGRFYRNMARMLGFLNMVLTLVVLFLAIKLRFGG
ncbi:protein of unknown function DUF474 [Thermocrinis albus DSM 14484]|uniref:Copper resistance protein D domain-containing protein n=1 Tax=Thermocrinis albus (strain DSM 14484 / JCM 11386 / HI 11/12) TaxID=638303 RepID=D3SLC3_THEAH|nr:hypothetical protein [Thermocrinis albus]ADC89553.1 protein of unknown function DUF474 [Thermocrinis albus DSM 14484]